MITVGSQGFDYDAAMRLSAITNAETTLSYDSSGALAVRALTNGTTLAYAGAFLTITKTGTATTARAEILVGGTRVASVWHESTGAQSLYYHRDRLGSAIATSKGGGTAGAAYRYDAWGAVVAQTGDDDASKASDLGYTSGLRLSAGLIHLRARVYNPALRQFMQPDNVDGLRYAYAAGDPANRIDPSGHMWGDFVINFRPYSLSVAQVDWGNALAGTAGMSGTGAGGVEVVGHTWIDTGSTPDSGGMCMSTPCEMPGPTTSGYYQPIYGPVDGAAGAAVGVLNDALQRAEYHTAIQGSSPMDREAFKLIFRNRTTTVSSTLAHQQRPINIANSYWKSAESAGRSNAGVDAAAARGAFGSAAMVGVGIILAGVDVANAPEDEQLAVANANVNSMAFGYLAGEASGMLAIGAFAVAGTIAAPAVVAGAVLVGAVAGGMAAYAWTMDAYGH